MAGGCIGVALVNEVRIEFGGDPGLVVEGQGHQYVVVVDSLSDSSSEEWHVQELLD